MEKQLESVPIELRVTHCYRMSDTFEQSEEQVHTWPIVRADTPEAGDRLELWIGEVPPEIRSTHRVGRAHHIAALRGFRVAESRESERDVERSIDATASGLEDPAELVADGPATWATLRISRVQQVEPGLIVSDSRYAWLSPAYFLRAADEFEDAVASTLSAVAAIVLPTLPGSARRVYTSATSFHLIGREPISGMHAEVGVPTISIGHPLEAVQVSEIRELMASLRVPDADVPVDRKLAHLADVIWTVSAEDDDWKRFMWAVAGLEYLATTEFGRSRGQLVALLTIGGVDADQASGLVEQLISPDREDGSSAYRSTVFRFAAMAAVLSPSTADDDVATVPTGLACSPKSRLTRHRSTRTPIRWPMPCGYCAGTRSSPSTGGEWNDGSAAARVIDLCDRRLAAEALNVTSGQRAAVPSPPWREGAPQRVIAVAPTTA
jgi:hypothetical protein